MCEFAVPTPTRYDALVPSYLDFVRQPSGSVRGFSIVR